MSKIRHDVENSFDELIRSRYGRSSPIAMRDVQYFDQLVRGYHGAPLQGKKRPKRRTELASLVLSLSVDDGEILPQVVPQEPQGHDRPAKTDGDFEEYVVAGAVGNANAASPQNGNGKVRAAPEPETAPVEEHQVDLRQPTVPEAVALPPESASPAAVAPPAQPSAAPDASPDKPTEDDFLADMQSILSGQKVFDPVSKQTVQKEKLGAAQSPAKPLPRNTSPAPEAENNHAIFDRIAQSMQYANAYDLGTVELENRFSNFDRAYDAEQDQARHRNSRKPKTSSGGIPSDVGMVGTRDFMEDLEAMRQNMISRIPDQPVPEEMPDYSRPFYDTGEHVQTGGDLYDGSLRVGQPPGVLFSYGQIIAMADLYESVDQMMAASVQELQNIKSLIERSTQYYQQGKRGTDVSSSDWETATHGRYLRLAENNYEHFSPNILLPNTPAGRAAVRFGNNKTAWQHYHQRAIEEAQRILLDPQNAGSSPFPNDALVINAFGDHFLTDAFAAGHLINKEVMIRLFKQNFYNGSSLKPEAVRFFERVARRAFTGNLARRFSNLETTDYPVCAWGWCIRWHPNINSADRFSRVLVGAAEQEPDRIANFAVKAMHDHLNREGIEVVNQAGDGNWRLTGDTTLNQQNLDIIHKSVQQSVNNINDPAIQASNLDYQTFFSKVWKYVPQPTESARQSLERMMRDYTRPDSDLLANAAAQILHNEVDTLIQTLIDERHLQPA